MTERTRAAVLKIQVVFGHVARSYLRNSAVGRCSRIKCTNAQQHRRDGRVDEGGGLENRYTGNCIVGSNPTPSAMTRLAEMPLTLC